MSQERVTQTLIILGENPHQSYSQVRERLIKDKLKHAARKGHNSEVIIDSILEKVPEVLDIRPYHQFIGDLDADLICELEDAEPIYIQVKTSEPDAKKFREKIKRRWQKGIKARFVALSFEEPFDEIIEDFVAQVNNLEGRKLLKAVKY